MGVSYLLRCASCYEKVENVEVDDEESIDAYDEAWEDLYEKLDPDFYLGWGEVGIERLFKWCNEHKEHGKIEFTAE